MKQSMGVAEPSREYMLIIPVQLDVDQHQRKYPTTDIEDFDKWKLLYIVHLLNYLPAVAPSMRHISGFVQVDSQLLKKSILHYKAYLTYLENSGVICANNSYSTRLHFAKSYKLIHPYDGSDLQFIPMSASKFRNSITTLIEVDKTKQEIADQHDGLLNIEIAHESALRSLQLVQDGLRMQVDNELLEYFNHRRREITVNLWRFSIHQISMIVDNTAGRLHSNLTSLKAEFRNFLTYKGEQLISIDVKNCQPFISQRILDTDFWIPSIIIPDELLSKLSNHKEQSIPAGSQLASGADSEEGATDVSATDVTGSVSNTITTNTEQQLRNNNNIHRRIVFSDIQGNIEPTLYTRTLDKGITEAFNMWQNNPNDDLLSNDDELRRFKSLINSGTIYEQLVEFANEFIKSDERWKQYSSAFYIKGETDSFQFSRSGMKKLVMLILFGPPNSNNPQAEFARIVFGSQFPNTLKVFNNLKRLFIDENGKRVFKYSSLAILLQALESEIILRRIVRRVKLEMPNAPVFTIHDSLLTTKEFVTPVRVIMYDEFQIAIGARPQLEVVEYSPDKFNIDDYCRSVIEKYEEVRYSKFKIDEEDEGLPDVTV